MGRPMVRRRQARHQREPRLSRCRRCQSFDLKASGSASPAQMFGIVGVMSMQNEKPPLVGRLSKVQRPAAAPGVGGHQPGADGHAAGTRCTAISSPLAERSPARARRSRFPRGSEVGDDRALARGHRASSQEARRRARERIPLGRCDRRTLLRPRCRRAAADIATAPLSRRRAGRDRELGRSEARHACRAEAFDLHRGAARGGSSAGVRAGGRRAATRPPG